MDTQLLKKLTNKAAFLKEGSILGFPFSARLAGAMYNCATNGFYAVAVHGPAEYPMRKLGDAASWDKFINLFEDVLPFKSAWSDCNEFEAIRWWAGTPTWEVDEDGHSNVFAPGSLLGVLLNKELLSQVLAVVPCPRSQVRVRVTQTWSDPIMFACREWAFVLMPLQHPGGDKVDTFCSKRR
jgi:hypothetical protein